MGRPQAAGVKKGPWTPEEDIKLVSYIHEHGPGTWRAVPTNTGLMRCSKSCRLRWTNYLRPGIKRGNFTGQEDKLILHLHALLGNRWAAIASYLPERTDNDIKNYWNTHLKKTSSAAAGENAPDDVKSRATTAPKGQWERRLQTDIHTALSLDTSTPTTGPAQPTYASSADNIARLLEGWMRPGEGGDKPSSGSRSSASLSGHSGTAPTPEGSTVTSKTGDGRAAAAAAPALSVLQNWLFDDGMGHAGVGLMDVPLGDPTQFF